MTNVYDKAYELEKAIKESQEFRDLEQSFKDMMADSVAKDLFVTFRDTQIALQEKQMQGAEITEEDMLRAESMVKDVQQNEKIAQMMDKEHRLNIIMNDVSRILTTPVEELYSIK